MVWQSRGLYFAPDGAGGSGDPPAGDPPQPPPAPLDFAAWLAAQPEDVKKLLDGHTAGLRSALDKEREAHKVLEKSQRDVEAAKKAAEEEALKQKQEWKTLAEQREAKLKELEPVPAQLEQLQGTVERYKKALESQLAESRKGLLPHLVALLDKLDPVEQLEYLAANQEALKKPPVGVPPTPSPTGDGKLSDDERRKRSFRPRL